MQPVSEGAGSRTAVKEQDTEERTHTWPLLVLSAATSAVVVYTMPSWTPLLRRAVPPSWFPSISMPQITSTSSSGAPAAADTTTQPLIWAGVRLGFAYLGTMLLSNAFHTLWTIVERECTVTAIFDSKDEAWRWMMEWLADNKAAQTTSLVSVLTSWRAWGHHNASVPAEEDGASQFRVLYVPAPGVHVVNFRGKRLWITRARRGSQPNANVQDETISVTMVGRSQAQLRALVAEAMNVAMSKDKCRTVVFVGDQNAYWKRTGSKPIRPMDSVVLEAGLAERLYKDVTDFLKSEKYYAERGIPYRRGYLLYGPPGCGKTSFMIALAGALGMNVYVINLSNKRLTDEALVDLLAASPLRSLVIIEDVDAAAQSSSSDGEGVSFSGLLNALDGIVAQEGRSIWMTTNHIDTLNPTLIRPGRVDVKAYFGLATKEQIKRLAAKFMDDPVVCEQLAERIGDGKVSMAALQGLLIHNRSMNLTTLDDTVATFLSQQPQQQQGAQ